MRSEGISVEHGNFHQLLDGAQLSSHPGGIQLQVAPKAGAGLFLKIRDALSGVGAASRGDEYEKT